MATKLDISSGSTSICAPVLPQPRCDELRLEVSGVAIKLDISSGSMSDCSPVLLRLWNDEVRPEGSGVATKLDISSGSTSSSAALPEASRVDISARSSSALLRPSRDTTGDGINVDIVEGYS